MEKQEDTSNILLLIQLPNNPEENVMPIGRCLERFFYRAMVKSTTDFWAVTTLPHKAMQSSSGSEDGFWARLFVLEFRLCHLLPVKI